MARPPMQRVFGTCGNNGSRAHHQQPPLVFRDLDSSGQAAGPYLACPGTRISQQSALRVRLLPSICRSTELRGSSQRVCPCRNPKHLAFSVLCRDFASLEVSRQTPEILPSCVSSAHSLLLCVLDGLVHPNSSSFLANVDGLLAGWADL